MALNRVVLVGRLTRDPEMKYTPQGIAVANMGIAVQRFTKNDTGDYDVDFFELVAWRRTAEFANTYLKKGSLVSVDGRLQQRSWVAQDGTKRNNVEITVENLNSVGPREGDRPSSSDYQETGSQPENAASTSTQAQTSAPPKSSAKPPADEVDDADPFADE